MTWYDKAKLYYPRKYMTKEQVDILLSKSLITPDEYNDIVGMQ